jgi:CO/xanthine dehydrogenase FAD-binding subunit
MSRKLEQIENQIEKLKQRRSEAEAALKAAQRRLQDQQRRKRFRHLIDIGELAEKTKIHNFDPVLLLGAFAQVADMLQDEVTKANCRKLGEKLMKVG